MSRKIRLIAGLMILALPLWGCGQGKEGESSQALSDDFAVVVAENGENSDTASGSLQPSGTENTDSDSAQDAGGSDASGKGG